MLIIPTLRYITILDQHNNSTNIPGQPPQQLPNQHKRWKFGAAIAAVVFGLVVILGLVTAAAFICSQKESSKSENITEFIAQNVTENIGEFDRDTYNHIYFRKDKTDTNTVEVYASTTGDILTYSLSAESNVLRVFPPFRGDLQAPYLYTYLVAGSSLWYMFEITNETGTDVNYTFLLFNDYKKKEAFRETGEGGDGAIYIHNVTSVSPASFNVTRTSFYFAMLQAPTQATVAYEYKYIIIGYNRSHLGSPVCVLNPNKDHCNHDIDQDLLFFVYTLPQEQEQNRYLYLDIQATKRPPPPLSCYITIGVSGFFCVVAAAAICVFLLVVRYCCK